MFGLFNFGGGVFEANYRCYPVSFLDKLDAENGDKIFLPPSALDRLASLHVEYPMLFRLENRRSGRTTHCGVLEFIADEGVAYLPYWMMQNLVLEEGDVISVRSATLPKGSYVKLQPHTQDFLDISNPKAVLETTLRGYSCLSKGDCICLHYNNKRFYIDIVETKPQDAISVIETDCEVDFAPPLDYVEPNRDEGPQSAPASAGTAADEAGPAGDVAPEEPKFVPFRGTGQRLDGKPAAPPSVPLPAPGTSAAGAGPSGNSATANGAPAVPRQKSGKVVFKGPKGNRLLAKQAQTNGATPDKPAAPPPPPPPEESKDAPKFSAFSGTARKLKDDR